jgi:hypothetical protein
MKYSLWDTEIGSRLGRFDSADEALAFVRTLMATYDRAKLRDLSLNWRDEHGNIGEEVTGEDLLCRAEEGAREREPVKAGGSYDAAGTNASSRGGASNRPMAASPPKRNGG